MAEAIGTRTIGNYGGFSPKFLVVSCLKNALLCIVSSQVDCFKKLRSDV